MKYQEIVKSHPLVLVDYYADWCGPCKMMAPVFKQLKSELGDKIKIVKIDTEKNKRLSASMGIRSIPTMMLYQNGEMVWQQPGAMSFHQLKSKLDQYLN
jgi:thioredoxin 1